MNCCINRVAFGSLHRDTGVRRGGARRASATQPPQIAEWAVDPARTLPQPMARLPGGCPPKAPPEEGEPSERLHCLDCIAWGDTFRTSNRVVDFLILASRNAHIDCQPLSVGLNHSDRLADPLTNNVAGLANRPPLRRKSSASSIKHPLFTLLHMHKGGRAFAVPSAQWPKVWLLRWWWNSVEKQAF